MDSIKKKSNEPSRLASNCAGAGRDPSMGKLVAFSATFLVAAIGVALGCSSTPTDPDAVTGPVTYYKDVAPILQEHCQNCHVPGGIAPFALTTYEGTKGYAGIMVGQTGSRLMPPWGAQETSDCTPRFGWQHDPRLSKKQINTLKAWSDQGVPAGNPNDAPPAIAPFAEGLSSKDIELAPKKPFAITDTSKDTFQCVVLDPGLTQETWVNGVAFIPGNKSIAHHAVIFLDPQRESLKKMGPDGSYPCFGDPGFQTAGLLGAWAPGSVARDYPVNVGMDLKPGTLIVAQMHYHPSVSDPSANQRPDPFKLQLRYSKAPPEYNLVFALIGNLANPVQAGTGLLMDPTDPNALSEFKIPAGSVGKTVTEQFVIPPSLMGNQIPHLSVYGIGVHMHWVGTQGTIRVKRALAYGEDPKEECLVGVPHWDFNWQRAYAYNQPDLTKLPGLSPFDTVTLKCTYDNSLGNPKVVQALKEQGLSQPKDVSLGETTLDEMCLGVYELIFKRL